MLKNYLKTAWRNLLKNKLQTSINIIGLAVGIAGCLSVFLLINYEFSFNKNISDEDRIYRVYTQFQGQFSGAVPGVPTGMATLAGSTLHDVEAQCLFHTTIAKVAVPTEMGDGLIRFKTQEDIIVAGPSFFNLVQNYEWLAGSPRQSLSEPFQVVLTESKAKKYFGVKNATEAIGRELIYGDSLYMTVSGILNDPSFFSDFYFTDFISNRTVHNSLEIPREEWSAIRRSDQFFIKAAEGVSMLALAEQLEPLNKRLNKGNTSKEKHEFKLQPLSDLHFNHELGQFEASRKPFRKGTLYGLMFIASLLLLVAAINFINLATVQATQRSKETGIRKAIGASRQQLTLQFLVETALVALLALPIVMILSEYSLQYFSEFLPQELTLETLSPEVLLFLLAAVIVVTFLAGLYPSFFMSSFHPAFAIKNQLGGTAGRKYSGLRKGLIVFQFVLAQVFIIGVFVMGNQMDYMLHKDLGFEKEAIVYFNIWDRRTDPSKRFVFQNQLKKIQEVEATAFQNKPPIDKGYRSVFMEFEHKNEEVKSEVHFRMVDTAYVGLYGMKLMAGRNLHPSDTIKELLVNEAFVQKMGFQKLEDAINRYVNYNNKKLPIVGILKDFHVRSFHHIIPPVALGTHQNGYYSIAAKISLDQPIPATINKIKAAWSSVYPDREFNYYFLDEAVEKMYESEAQLKKLISTATGLAIFISCLGLFGLTFFTVTQRSKEISIRKVLGASVASVVRLLSRDFLKLVILALIIASPLAYYFMNEWLEGFAYHTKMEWWVFAIAGLISIAITFITVGAQGVRAAIANPVNSLKSE